jgi:hypothetical protein
VFGDVWSNYFDVVDIGTGGVGGYVGAINDGINTGMEVTTFYNLSLNASNVLNITSSSVQMSGQQIKGVGEPTDPSDAATRNYVDNLVNETPVYTVFVSKDGVPGANGSFMNPYRYLQDAIDYIQGLGDTTNPWTIIMGPGDYSGDGSVALVRPLTHIMGSTIGGPDSKATTIGMIDITPYAVFGSIANSVVSLSNLLVKGSGNQNGVWLRGNQGCTLEINRVFSFVGGTGIALYNDQTVGTNSRLFATDSTFSSTSGTGEAIKINDGSCRPTTCRIYAGSGAAVSFSASSGILANCELSSTGSVVAEVAGSQVSSGFCSYTSAAANSTAVNMTGVSVFYSSQSTFNVPVGTGFAVKGVLGCIYYNALNVYAQNPKVSSAMGAGVVNLQTAYVLA